MKRFARHIIHCLSALAVLGGSGCSYWVVGHHGSPPHAAVYGKLPGPPPHAPAYGYRAKCRYYYYPDIEVYYDPVRGCYFWFEAGYWRTGYAVPQWITVRSYTAVTIELDTLEPYVHHADVKAKHPRKHGGKAKYKG